MSNQEQWHKFNTLDLHSPGIEQRTEGHIAEVVKKEGGLSVLKSKIGKFARAGFLIGWSMLAADGMEARVAEPAAKGKKSTPGQVETPKVEMQTSNPESKERDSLLWPAGEFEFPGIDHTFFKKNAKGETVFNGWALIAPFAGHIGVKEKIQGVMDIDIPFEYARAFDLDPHSGKPLNPEDRDKAIAFLRKEMNRRFADTITEYFGPDGVYKYQHGELPEHALDVEEISITGFASPEGPRKAGKSSLEPGAIDAANLQLAKKRAEAAFGLTQQELQQFGVSAETVDKVLTKINMVEMQMEEPEYDELDAACTRLGVAGADRLERIFELVKMYNEKRVEDPQAKQALDKIIASKRKVNIHIKYKGEKTDTYSIPIPLLLLIPLLFRRLRQKSPGAEQPTPTPQPEANPTPEFVRPQIPEYIRTTSLPEPGSPEYIDMEERTIIDDLGKFFGDEQNKRRGLDYQAIAETVEANWEKFPDNTERELYLTQEILAAWKINDTKAREEAGITNTEGLDYENQPKQIQWARMHARGLLTMVNIKKEKQAQGLSKQANYEYALGEVARPLMLQREVRRIKELGGITEKAE